MSWSEGERSAAADASQCGVLAAALPQPTPAPLPLAAERPLAPEFFARPAERVAPELVGCLLVRRLPEGGHVWGMVVETEAYCQSEPACHGHRRRSAANDTLFGRPGRFYVYLTYGLHHCVNVVTDREDWANGVLLRAVALPAEPERAAAGPALLARRFGIDRSHDRLPADPASGLWFASRPAALRRWWRSREDASEPPLLAAPRVGISQAADLPWRWYLRASRSVSRRARGDRTPKPERALRLEALP